MRPNKKLYKDLTMIFETWISKFNVLWVYHWIYKSCRLFFNDFHLKVFDSICSKYELFYAVQDYKIMFVESNNEKLAYNDYVITDNSNPDWLNIVYLSKNSEFVYKQKKFDKQWKKENELEWYSYPSCCIESYIEKINNYENIPELEQVDYTFQCAKNLEIYPFYNNICLRLLDIYLILHYPCHFGCKKSVDIWKKFFEMIKKYDKNITDHISTHLKSFVIYTKELWTFYWIEYEFKDNTIHYKQNFYWTEQNEIFELLKNNNKIICHSNNDFEIWDKRFKDIWIICMFW